MSDTEPSDVGTPTGRTRLIVAPDDALRLTPVRQTDVRTALTRGLKEYLETLVIEYGGRVSKFERVLQTWSVPEVPAAYPSAVVYAVEPGVYDDASFTPITTETVVPGSYVRLACEFVQQVVVEVYSTDPQERVALTSMLEDAFCPVDWMYGFRLELPHYHGVRADFEPLSMAYIDFDTEAQARRRKTVLVLTGRCPQVRRAVDRAGRPLPLLDVRVDYQITDDPAGPPAAPYTNLGTVAAATGRPLRLDGTINSDVGSGQPE